MIRSLAGACLGWLLCWGMAGAAEQPVRATVEERFSSADVQETPDFRRHVLPLLGRLGCNGRACHGSFQGQGDFRLSLFGFDFAADLAALTGGDSPRVNQALPAESLILKKGTLAIDHGGGQRMPRDGWAYRVLERWIAAGAPGRAENSVEFSTLTVEPRELRFSKPGDTAPLKVVVKWSDGSREDVTPLCRFRTNDESVASVDESGLVTALTTGDTHVVAFFDNGVAPVSVLTPVTENHDERYPNVPTPTKVDELIVSKLRRLGIIPSEVAGDAEFLRRVSLDMAGVLPSPEEVSVFLADKRGDKRRRKIDELLERPAYAAWWTTKLCDFTGNNGQQLNEQPFSGPQAAQQWYAWIYKRVLTNTPYDELAAGMILANGRLPGESYDDYCRAMGRLSQDDDGSEAADRATMPHFWMRRNNRRSHEKAQSFAYAFLGVRLQCAECHKHPFDQWTKQDHDDFKQFFERVDFGISPDAKQRQKELNAALAEGNQKPDLRKELPRYLAEGKLVPYREVFAAPIARPKKLKPGETAPAAYARLLEGEQIDLNQHDDPRLPLVEWLRRDAERYFARAFVNRTWANYFSVGIIEPADDLNRANAPSNAELLDYLTKEFVRHKFDMKWLHREIANSRAYQLSCTPNASNRLDTRNFSRAVPRRLPAEVAYNALLQATARVEDLPAFHTDPNRLATGNGPAKGGRKGDYALMVFGRPARATNCDCERSMEPTLLQTLFLRNDEEVLNLIQRGDGWLQQLEVARNRRSVVDRREQTAAKVAEQQQQMQAVAARLQELEQPLPDDPDQGVKARQRAAAKRQADLKNFSKQQRQLEKSLAQQQQQLEKLDQQLQVPAIPLGDDLSLVKEIYLRTVSRLPTEQETARIVQFLSESEDRQAGLRDVVWALVNTKEFILNH